MLQRNHLSRRTFLAASAAASASLLSGAGKKIPVGLELFSVRDEMAKDLMATVRAVGKMGYDAVEFYSPYYGWTTEYAKSVRKLMDDVGLRCPSTHNGANALSAAGIEKAIELNGILGSKLIVMASAGKVEGLEGWKKIADQLSEASTKLKPHGMRAGFHNHQLEFQKIGDQRPMDVLAKNTPKDVVLQLDVGTAVEVGVDPVAWINSNPGRIRSMHCKDWGKEGGYHVLVGEGQAPWKQIVEAAEKTGGIECYMIEQEGSRMSSMETAVQCLANWKKIKG